MLVKCSKLQSYYLEDNYNGSKGSILMCKVWEVVEDHLVNGNAKIVFQFVEGDIVVTIRRLTNMLFYQKIM